MHDDIRRIGFWTIVLAPAYEGMPRIMQRLLFISLYFIQGGQAINIFRHDQWCPHTHTHTHARTHLLYKWQAASVAGWEPIGEYQ